jgi:hypothetical protein
MTHDRSPGNDPNHSTDHYVGKNTEPGRFVHVQLASVQRASEAVHDRGEVDAEAIDRTEVLALIPKIPPLYSSIVKKDDLSLGFC